MSIKVINGHKWRVRTKNRQSKRGNDLRKVVEAILSDPDHEFPNIRQFGNIYSEIFSHSFFSI